MKVTEKTRMASRVKRDRVRLKESINRGRPRWVEVVWYFVKMLFFVTSFPWPSRIKVMLLRLFGAQIGSGLCIKPRVNVHMPWNLVIGDCVSIGEDVFILNFEKVELGDQTTISQRAFLCTGNHDFRDPGFPYRNRPIHIFSGAWVGAQVFVGPGVIIGVDSIVAAGSTVTKNIGDNLICRGNPAQIVGIRWAKEVSGDELS